MRIIPIFGENLYVVHYKSKKYNEYRRLMEDWNGVHLLELFLKENKQDLPKAKDVYKVIEEIIDERNEINHRLLKTLKEDPVNLDQMFRQLNNPEYRTINLSLRKGKSNHTHHLRLYAIRIEADMYVITGGAIKLPLHHLMEDRTHTKIELDKLNQMKMNLKENGVFDKDSFCELLNE